jgi:hypothetical protein
MKELRPVQRQQMTIIGEYVVRFFRPSQNSIVWCVRHHSRVRSYHTTRRGAIAAALIYHRKDKAKHANDHNL